MGLDSFWHYSARSLVPAKVRPEELLHRLAEQIRSHGIAEVRLIGDRIAFREAVWRQFLPYPRWSRFGAFDSGEIWLETNEGGTFLRVRLRFFHLLIISLAAGISFGALVASSQGFGSGISFGGLAFAMAYGINYVFGAATASNLLRDAKVAAGSDDDFSLTDKVGCLAILAAGVGILLWILLARY